MVNMHGLKQYILQGYKDRRLLKSDVLVFLRQLKNQGDSAKRSSHLHPLVHVNTSNLSEQRFCSTFTGDEFFLKDHQVYGQKVLPGVAYLEMAREAVKQTTDGFSNGSQCLHLKNVMWARPITVGADPREVKIGLFLEENGEIAYEIYTHPQDAGDEPLLHSQGVATFAPPEKMPSLNLADLQAGLNEQRLNPEACYEAFKKMGIAYGPAHQGLTEVYVGDNEVLAKLTLPACVSGTKDPFILHPSLLDSALQASIGIGLGKEALNGELRPSLPFALEHIDIIGRCPESVWAWIRPVRDPGVAGNTAATVQKLDIDLCDESGYVCVKMQGFSSRVLNGKISQKSEEIGTLMVKPVWKEKSIDRDQPRAEYSDHHVFLCGLSQNSHGLQDKASHILFTDLESDRKTLSQCFEAYSLKLFESIQEILQEKPDGNVLVQVLVPAHGSKQIYSALSGLIKTAHLENPKVLGQVIAVGEAEGAEVLMAKVEANRNFPEDQQIRYENEKRLVASFEEVTSTDSGLPWKDGGVYLITGGAGGLGLIFAKEIVEKARGAILILTGRSALTKEKKERLKELEGAGATVVYKSVDVCDLEGVERLIREVQYKFGSLNGIIHSAGVIRDNFILKKSKAEFEQVLAPKVTGVMNLDRATKELDLDFLVLFSSGAGATGNVGQADYATANAFMDAFAKFRTSLLDKKERSGQTLSINWSLWREGGMGVDEATEKMLKERIGMIPMETSSGIEAFYRGLAANTSQVMVMKGNLGRLYEFFRKEALGSAENQEEEVGEGSGSEEKSRKEALDEKVVIYFKRQLSKVLGLPVQKIEAEEPLEKYGIDSIMVMQLTNELEKTFGSLSKTLFFEYQTIQEISQYFLKSHEEKLREILSVDRTRAGVEGTGLETVTEVAPLERQPRRSRFLSIPESSLATRSVTPLDIAIIGLSGRYPQAQNLEEYWENLRTGKNCINEVPEDRWDWREFYTENRSQSGAHYSKWGGFIEDVDKFDPLFFNISPREAEFMDPQERLFLEIVWKALEDAGYCRADLQGEPGEYLPSQVGVYAGVMYSEYQLFGAEASLAWESNKRRAVVMPALPIGFRMH